MSNVMELNWDTYETAVKSIKDGKYNKYLQELMEIEKTLAGADGCVVAHNNNKSLIRSVRHYLKGIGNYKTKIIGDYLIIRTKDVPPSKGGTSTAEMVEVVCEKNGWDKKVLFSDILGAREGLNEKQIAHLKLLYKAATTLSVHDRGGRG